MIKTDQEVPKWVTVFIVAVPLAIVVLGSTIVYNILSNKNTQDPIQSAKVSVDVLDRLK